MQKNIVLHVTASLNYGGVESHMKIIAKNPMLTIFDHKFAAISDGGSVSEYIKNNGCFVFLLRARAAIPSLIAIQRLIRLIRRERPVILHTHGAEANFHGLIAGRICGVPVSIAEEIGFPRHSRRARLIFKGIYRFAHRVVAISNAVKCKLVELDEAEPEKIRVLSNPVEMLSERNSCARSDRFQLGFVGRLEAVKNPIALIGATAILRDLGLPVNVTIVGDGSQRKHLEGEISRFKLHEAVTLQGFLPNPFDYLRNIDLYVQPSITEGFGLALVEAMSVGIPAVATSVGGAPEIISDGKNGWLLYDTGPEAIASAIKKCYEMGPNELFRTGQIARRSVVDRFAPSAYLKACDALYTDALRGVSE